ncbi:hypothetical protein ACPVTF_09645 [Geobacillus icigianus]|nr:MULTISPECIES: hypothetical protein [Geobacillus]KYD30897.1 hypothetical protein B4113_2744 [Geobacillus sp. B4113_201601]
MATEHEFRRRIIEKFHGQRDLPSTRGRKSPLAGVGFLQKED